MMWSFGIPSALEAWQSVEYDEATYTNGNIAIIDARGQAANGKRWRYPGKFGESADYSDVDEPTARILDRVLDGACLGTPNPR
jgi:hypothetical protein